MPLPLALALIVVPAALAEREPPIDRQSLVQRHNLEVRALDSRSPVQVGNGEFAFSMDLTGLQTFTPFNTMAQWGWNSGPLPSGERIEDFQGQVWETHGRPVRYPMPDPARPGLSGWMASNPHKINLGRIALWLRKKDGSTVLPADLKSPVQRLDLWSGVVTSRFVFDGAPVTVKTSCHPTQDAIGLKIESPLVAEGRIGVLFSAPGDAPQYFANYVGDWANPAELSLSLLSPNEASLKRKLDSIEVESRVRWEGEGSWTKAPPTTGDLRVIHAKYGAGDKWLDVTGAVSELVQDGQLSVRVDDRFKPDPAPGLGKRLVVTYAIGDIAQVVEANQNELLTVSSRSERNVIRFLPARGSKSIFFSCAFSSKQIEKAPSAAAVFDESRRHWPSYWRNGAMVELSGSKDPRGKELERRVILSQYLMAVNTAGSLPPQESGLVNNGWFGKFHMEMVWWHGAHWALWNRWSELEGYLGIYARLLPSAKAKAAGQGYEGARWPKAIGSEGREWPHEIHALLAWQQPHPIFFSELAYRMSPSKETLRRWWPVVDETARFMASYAHLNPGTGQYDLGPPLHLVSENVDPKVARNPAFELGYWRFGLRTAQAWRKRMGMAPDAVWAKVLSGLAPLPTEGDVYVTYEGVPDMWTRLNYEHPALIGGLGMLPGDGVDRVRMERTLRKVHATWHFNRTWGWDFPMLAMCAARLGLTDMAVDFLLHPSEGFQFDQRGLATGGPFPYFPSNGGLLYAVAMMAGGWDGAPSRMAPGFPSDGSWTVKAEGFAAAP